MFRKAKKSKYHWRLFRHAKRRTTTDENDGRTRRSSDDEESKQHTIRQPGDEQSRAPGEYYPAGAPPQPLTNPYALQLQKRLLQRHPLSRILEWTDHPDNQGDLNREA